MSGNPLRLFVEGKDPARILFLIGHGHGFAKKRQPISRGYLPHIWGNPLHFLAAFRNGGFQFVQEVQPFRLPVFVLVAGWLWQFDYQKERIHARHQTPKTPRCQGFKPGPPIFLAFTAEVFDYPGPETAMRALTF
jgi:hypothetical protein